MESRRVNSFRPGLGDIIRVNRRAWLGMAAGGLILAAGGRPRQAFAETMLRRPIPSTGEMLPVVGLGTWRTFDVAPQPPLLAQRRAVIEALLDAGGAVIDSSPMYGRSERVVGDLLKDLSARDRAFLATKVWTNGRQSGLRQMAKSATRFHTPHIDLMQIHNLVDWRTHMPQLRAGKEAGKFRYIGVTHWTRDALTELATIVRSEPIDFVQCAYSIGVTEAADILLPLCQERGVAVLVNRPFEQGRLFRRVGGRTLPDWVAEFDCRSWGQFFLKFILAHPAVSCVIPGTSRPRHMRDNAGAGLGGLPSPQLRDRMQAMWKEL